MTTTVNKSRDVATVANVTPSGLEIRYRVPLAGNRTAQKLSVTSVDGQIVNFTNSQVRALLRVVTAGRRAARR